MIQYITGVLLSSLVRPPTPASVDTVQQLIGRTHDNELVYGYTPAARLRYDTLSNTSEFVDAIPTNAAPTDGPTLTDRISRGERCMAV